MNKNNHKYLKINYMFLFVVFLIVLYLFTSRVPINVITQSPQTTQPVIVIKPQTQIQKIEQTMKPREDYVRSRIMSLNQPQHYVQLGVLTNTENQNDILPLFGKQSATHRYRWNYYTITDRLSNIRMPVHHKERDCTINLGCDELYDGDIVNVPITNSTYKVTVYNKMSVF
jgi:hypothetical protein